MMRSLHSGVTGLKSTIEGITTVSKNIANMNTIGYRRIEAKFEDLISSNLALYGTPKSGVNQVGLGVKFAGVRTIQEEGKILDGINDTDLAISGKGFFEVSNGNKTLYTRAGNFAFDKEGHLKDPTGLSLMGMNLTPMGNPNEVEPIQIDKAKGLLSEIPGKQTSFLKLSVNLSVDTDRSMNSKNPYFNLLERWKGLEEKPLSDSSYLYAQPLKVYDENGNNRKLAVYFDGAPNSESGHRNVEFLVAMSPEEDGSSAAGTDAAGLLMSGTITFSNDGNILNMSAFTPNGSATKDLVNWKPANFSDGFPQLGVSFSGLNNSQQIEVDFGVKSQKNAWINAPNSAAEVGNTFENIGFMSAIEASPDGSSTLRGKGFSARLYKQDGYEKGSLTKLNITKDGIIQGKYSNNQSLDLYKIPLMMFRNEYGLIRKGDSHYVAPKEAGEKIYSDPNTKNVGAILSSSIETSNVELTSEIVDLINFQRSFQMSSKSVSKKKIKNK